jgi:hypothetical protein
MIKTCFLFILILGQTFALPLDSKVLGRIIGSSDSKRTILVNRGKEHGLREGDHAKISLPSGMVARGVVVKLSPGRSVWSVYRFFDAEKVNNNMVYTFKIAEPVKLTSDETKALGALAKKEIKKRERIPKANVKLTPAEIKRQKIMKNDLIRKERVLHKPDGIDYTKLEDHTVPLNKRDPSIDWRGLDEKGKHDYFNRVDYSALH